jgi:hypothetical protein
LEVDSARLERIVDVMWATIHRVLDRPAPRRRRIGGSDILGEAVNDHLTGGGASAEDVLTDAFAALLQTPETAVTTTWEGLAAGIARNKTKGALRKAGAWLHETEHRPRLTAISADAPGRPGSDGDRADPPLELIEDLAAPIVSPPEAPARPEALENEGNRGPRALGKRGSPRATPPGPDPTLPRSSSVRSTLSERLYFRAHLGPSARRGYL